MTEYSSPTNAGDDSTGKIWGIEGTLIFSALLGLLVSLAFSLYLYGFHYQGKTLDLKLCIGLGASPLWLCLIWIFGLKQGRTPAFDTDLLETILNGRSWGMNERQIIHPYERIQHSKDTTP